VTDLFLIASPGMSEDKAEAFDGVFEKLVEEADHSVMADISQRLAPLHNSPPKLINRLASDDSIEIAAPVLEHSPRLSTEDLRRIASVKGDQHLLAISKRTELAPAVTDVLVERGGRHIALSVAGNAGARFSERTLGDLGRRALGDDAIRSRLMTRSDVPAPVTKMLATATAEHNRERQTRAAAAQIKVKEMAQACELTGGSIQDFAAQGKYEEAIAAIALLSHQQYNAIESILSGDRPSGFILVCKGIGLPWSTVLEVLKMAQTAHGYSEENVRELHSEFLKVSKSTAERILRFWQARNVLGRE
jgi:uncharacterized protein (DUF2336 family)